MRVQFAYDDELESSKTNCSWFQDEEDKNLFHLESSACPYLGPSAAWVRFLPQRNQWFYRVRASASMSIPRKIQGDEFADEILPSILNAKDYIQPCGYATSKELAIKAAEAIVRAIGVSSW